MAAALMANENAISVAANREAAISAAATGEAERAKRPNDAWPALRIAHWQGVNGSDSIWW
jgi:hypothetical protein